MDLVELSTYQTVRHPWETAREHIIKALIASLDESTQKILDVGSGDAFLANGLTTIGAQVEAHCVDIEYTAALMATITAQFQNKQLHLYDDLSNVTLDHVDLVTLLDVIEHVPDEQAFLREIIAQDYVQSGTYFIVSVPAFQSLFAQHDVVLKHYRRYNRKTLSNALSLSGLEVLSSGYFFTSLLPPRVLQLLSEKIKKKDTSELKNLGNWNHGSVFTGLIKGTLLLDYTVGKFFRRLGIQLPGLSCYAICKLS